MINKQLYQNGIIDRLKSYMLKDYITNNLELLKYLFNRYFFK